MKLNSDYRPKFSGFHDLMQYRVREILLVSSLYDAFVLEEDGRISERIFSEYVDLNLRFIPKITRVSTAVEALELVAAHRFDLVITMPHVSGLSAMELGGRIKKTSPGIPVVMLTYEPVSPETLVAIRRTETIDKVFYWFGDTRILLAIIKYVEDMKNAPADAKLGVQIILLVEDSPRHYSFIFPILYTEVLKQTRYLVSDSVNDYQRMMRMRARPRILLVETYEQAKAVEKRYKNLLLGVISDIRFPRKEIMDPRAGIRLARSMRRKTPDLPILIQSMEEDTAIVAKEEGLAFLKKDDPQLDSELRKFIRGNFGFGDFCFRLPDGTEVDRARNIEEMIEKIHTIPLESLLFHARGNHFSIWLRARGEFEMAEEIRHRKIEDFENLSEIRDYIGHTLEMFFRREMSGAIADFGKAHFDTRHRFMRLGSGSIGGKARGIAFLNSLLPQIRELIHHESSTINIPDTFVISTDLFDEFMASNSLHEQAMACETDREVVRLFRKARVPASVKEAVRRFVDEVRTPIAVRSSSLLEDSKALPFAGMYKTFMLPNNHPEPRTRRRQLMEAIKLVYASVYLISPRQYAISSNLRIEEEKMAVIVQEIVGKPFKNGFYPVISGVAQSYNFYPFTGMKPEEGIVHLALGLGKTIVDGKKTYRFSPHHPAANPPYGNIGELIRNSQSELYALDLNNPAMKIRNNEGFSLVRLPLSAALEDGSLFYVGSTFCPEDGRLRDTVGRDGPKVVTFAHILKHRMFPLAEILREALEIGEEAFGSPVEIEFALNLSRNSRWSGDFYFLQIRPMVVGMETEDIAIPAGTEETAFCFSEKALGNGSFNDLRDIVLVDPETFNVANSREIAMEIGRINARFRKEERHYILIGFGRWATSDPWLGIPVDWEQISQAAVFVESHLGNFRVEPSHGSHFFHNMVSMKLGYIHVGKPDKRNFVDWDWLKTVPTAERTPHVRVLHMDKPLPVRINGKTGTGAILKPGNTWRRKISLEP
ncbi:MAG: phosphoenolpyruvate synthase [Acidobacteria bacterium]|nr:phosphoenolpyruvate synthase [Acidobacteriota bacterium]